MDQEQTDSNDGRMCNYHFQLDGDLFRQQRLLVIKLHDGRIVSELTTEQCLVLEGLTNLLDYIADQAHDTWGIDCLFDTEDEDDEDTTALQQQPAASPEQDPATESHWWLCPECYDTADVSYATIAEVGIPYCGECDIDFVYCGSRVELDRRLAELARADNPEKPVDGE